MSAVEITHVVSDAKPNPKYFAAGIVTTVMEGSSNGHLYLGCFEDDKDERVFAKKYVDAHMTTAVSCRGTSGPK